jgi:acetyl-CoA/propionyl-CoA carboxylase biotin carboxyl carrier protein
VTTVPDPVPDSVFDTVLIANRGEIALRVMRTCTRMGIRTVALFTDADATAPHTRAADDAVRVPSYLDIEAVVAAALESGAQAIHPGYGFLSERAAFAAAVEKAGLVLVGPTAEVMERMGRKDAAREIAVAAGVPVVPSYSMTDARASVVYELPYPVLVKAAAGGGGKGMRIVRGPETYAESVLAAEREALAAFGDGTVLLEKYVESGRHVEVQVLADHHGTVLHLFERDCSAQRRHQKVIEEAPAPTVDADLRERLTSAAVALAREVGYTNAGTVEFLLDNDSGEFYFLEMNTRLQVEHPVTEAVCGGLDSRMDLVEQQLRIAAGEPLTFGQDDLVIDGHAMEARVYAEDAFGGFLPQAGRASIVRWSSHARNDHALEPNQVVSTSYDPMLGKVVVHGPDRESARRALVRALDETSILGLTTNTGFLRALAASDAFRDHEIDTAWLDRAGHEALAPPDDELPRVLVAWTQAMLTSLTDTGHPFQADGFRLGGAPAPQVVALDEPVVVDRSAGRVTTGAGTYDVRELGAAEHVLTLLVDGRRVSAVVNVQPHTAEVVWRGQRFVFERPDVMGDHGPAVGDGTMLAPMPGTVLAVRVEVGQRVSAGDPLGTMEAMKMELALTAPFDGSVTQVGAAVGDQVALGAVLFTVEADE